MTIPLSRRGVLAGATTILTAPALAQAPWRPERPIRLIVGFAPGGLTDATARLIAPGLSELLGQPVVVENRPGAGANLSTEMVVRAPADGLTLLVSQGGQITINDLANGLISAANSSSTVLHAPERAGDVRNSRASSEKLRAAELVKQFKLEMGMTGTTAAPEQTSTQAPPTQERTL